jgi:hypothetical protein
MSGSGSINVFWGVIPCDLVDVYLNLEEYAATIFRVSIRANKQEKDTKNQLKRKKEKIRF